MNRKEIVNALIAILKEYQKEVGEEADEIYETTCPIGGLAYFDSLTGVTATVHCCERFGIESDEKVVSLFEGMNKRGYPCALTVGQIADSILNLIGKE